MSSILLTSLQARALMGVAKVMDTVTVTFTDGGLDIHPSLNVYRTVGVEGNFITDMSSFEEDEGPMELEIRSLRDLGIGADSELELSPDLAVCDSDGVTTQQVLESIDYIDQYDLNDDIVTYATMPVSKWNKFLTQSKAAKAVTVTVCIGKGTCTLTGYNAMQREVSEYIHSELVSSTEASGRFSFEYLSLLSAPTGDINTTVSLTVGGKLTVVHRFEDPEDLANWNIKYYVARLETPRLGRR